MKIAAKTGNDDIANVYIAEMGKGKLVEFVEAQQPPIPIEKKWVLIISTLFGCPVDCKICDAGGNYSGKLTKEELFDQIDFLIRSRYPSGNVPAEKFKIQFARMGDPAYNPAVCDVLEEIDNRYKFKSLMPCISTVAPKYTDKFFQRLLDIKNRKFKDSFQMQFSIHSTNEEQRNWLIPADKWSFSEIADYSYKFWNPGERKIALNFAVAKDSIIEPRVLRQYFDPEAFVIKLTPVNPTYSALESGIESMINPTQTHIELQDQLRDQGYDILLSIGEWEENKIGSNCGQLIKTLHRNGQKLEDAYKYDLYKMLN